MVIVKVQLPLSTNLEVPEALIYNQDRSILCQLPVSDDLKKSMGGAAKQYFFAELRGTILHLDKRAPWQDW